jgi:hypothetical protein
VHLLGCQQRLAVGQRQLLLLLLLLLASRGSRVGRFVRSQLGQLLLFVRFAAGRCCCC